MSASELYKKIQGIDTSKIDNDKVKNLVTSAKEKYKEHTLNNETVAGAAKSLITLVESKYPKAMPGYEVSKPAEKKEAKAKPATKEAEAKAEKAESTTKPKAKSKAKPKAKAKATSVKGKGKANTRLQRINAIRKMAKEKGVSYEVAKEIYDTETEFDKFKKSPDYSKATAGTNVEKDRQRTALAPGKRVSRTGKTYWENRANRSDVNRRVRLEKGGEVDTLTVSVYHYGEKKGDEIIDYLDLPLYKLTQADLKDFEISPEDKGKNFYGSKEDKKANDGQWKTVYATAEKFAKGGKVKLEQYIVFYNDKVSGGMRERSFTDKTQAEEFAKSVGSDAIKYANGGSIEDKKYIIVNNDTDNIYFKSTDKKLAELKLKEFKEIYPNDKIILQEVSKDDSIGDTYLMVTFKDNESYEKAKKHFDFDSDLYFDGNNDEFRSLSFPISSEHEADVLETEISKELSELGVGTFYFEIEGGEVEALEIISKEDALSDYRNNKEVFLIFEDGTEAVPENEMELLQHVGKYGREKAHGHENMPEVDWDFISEHLDDYHQNDEVMASDDLSRFIDGELDEEQHAEYIVDVYGDISIEKAKEIRNEIDQKLMAKAIEAKKAKEGEKFEKGGEIKENRGGIYSILEKLSLYLP